MADLEVIMFPTVVIFHQWAVFQVWNHKTILTPPPFIEVFVLNQES